LEPCDFPPFSVSVILFSFIPFFSMGLVIPLNLICPFSINTSPMILDFSPSPDPSVWLSFLLWSPPPSTPPWPLMVGRGVFSAPLCSPWLPQIVGAPHLSFSPKTFPFGGSHLVFFFFVSSLRQTTRGFCRGFFDSSHFPLSSQFSFLKTELS